MKIVNQILRLILLIITMSIVLFMFIGDIAKNSMAVIIFSIALGIYTFIICVVGNRITKAKIWAWGYVLIFLGLVLSFMLLAAQKEDTDTHSNWVYYIVYAVFACYVLYKVASKKKYSDEKDHKEYRVKDERRNIKSISREEERIRQEKEDEEDEENERIRQEKEEKRRRDEEKMRIEKLIEGKYHIRIVGWVDGRPIDKEFIIDRTQRAGFSNRSNLENWARANYPGKEYKGLNAHIYTCNLQDYYKYPEKFLCL